MAEARLAEARLSHRGAVLDTHVLLWMALDAARLSRNARRAIDKASQIGGLSVASISLWEIAQLVARGRLRVQARVGDWMASLLAETGVSVVELTPEIAELSTSFGVGFPKDPADRIIAATARASGSPLITADTKLRNSTLVQSIW